MSNEKVQGKWGAYSLDFFGDPEDLNPELAEFLEEKEGLGQILRHPLVFSVPHFPQLNRNLNRMLVAKRKAVAEARRARDWAHMLVLYERPYRLQALLDVAGTMSHKAFWESLAWVWIDTEFPHTNLETWLTLFSLNRPNRKYLMEPEEWQALEALPEEVTIFRGADREHCSSGLSWTTDFAVAQKFSKRFTKDPAIARGIVHKKDILAYFTGRNESEVLVDPEHVTKVRIK